MSHVPEMIPVDSSSIEAVAYDDEARRLHVRFRESGETYIYLDVDARVFDDLLAAESKGAYLNREVKGRFAFTGPQGPSR